MEQTPDGLIIPRHVVERTQSEAETGTYNDNGILLVVISPSSIIICTPSFWEGREGSRSLKKD